MRTLRRLLALGGSAALTIGFIVIGTGPAQAADQATVSILHGVPGATVDVYVDGKALLKNFKPGTLTDQQMLPAGSYDPKVLKAGDGADGDAIVEANNVKVPGGANITVVAHLTAKGKPALTPYVNDISTIPAGKARVIVRHDAAAPRLCQSASCSSASAQHKRRTRPRCRSCTGSPAPPSTCTPTARRY